MGVSKVVLGNQTVMDISEDNIAPNKMLRGTSAHNSAGNPINGTLAGQEWEDVTEAEYREGEAESDPDEETGVYDPNKMYFINDMDINGWVVTEKQLAYANSTTTLTFVHASIHPDSLIRIAAEDTTTKNMPLQGHNNTHPIFAKIAYQDEGECQISFDKQTNNTEFWLVIRNADDVADIMNQSSGQGSNPVGTIISYFGTTAPTGYLVCDGSQYNVVDYPNLANHLNTQFTGYVSGSTFTVPDLRGEFLRGTGTNSHTGQGNGAAVGVHQDGTAIPFSYGSNVVSGSAKTALINYDREESIGTDSRMFVNSSNKDPWLSRYTVRPTNTSVLYCIKY